MGISDLDLVAARVAIRSLREDELALLRADVAATGLTIEELYATQLKAEREVAEQNRLTAASQDDLQAGIEGVTGARRDATNEANLLAGAETALEIAQIAEGLAQGNLTEAKTAYNSALEEANRLTMDANATDEDRATTLRNLVIAAGNLTTAEGALATAIERTADATEDGTGRMISAWDRWRRNQDEVIASMNQNGIRFEDIVKQMAADLGLSTTQMSDEMELLGVDVGDTTALMELYGRERIGALVDQLVALKDTTDAAAKSLRELQSATKRQVGRAQSNAGRGTGSFLPVGDIGSGQEGYIASSSSIVPSTARDSEGNVRGRFVQTTDRAEFDRILAQKDPTRIPVFVTGGVPALASGGIVRASPDGTVVRLGEGGEDELVAPLPKLPSLFRSPELLANLGATMNINRMPIPLSRMDAMPMPQSRAVAGRGGRDNTGGDLSITINAENLYGENVTELIQEQIQRAHRRGWSGS